MHARNGQEPDASHHEAGPTAAKDDRAVRKPIREGEKVVASGSPNQPQVDRHGPHEDLPTTGDRRIPREDDPPEATPNKVVTPIQRPDPDGKPIHPRKPGAERGTER